MPAPCTAQWRPPQSTRSLQCHIREHQVRKSQQGPLPLLQRPVSITRQCGTKRQARSLRHLRNTFPASQARPATVSDRPHPRHTAWTRRRLRHVHAHIQSAEEHLQRPGRAAASRARGLTADQSEFVRQQPVEW